MPGMSLYRSLRNAAAACLAALLVASCATNAATGGRNVVFSSMEKEAEQSRRWYDEIIRFYGVYEDQAVQDYVKAVGMRIARNSDLPDLNWTFTVIDEGSLNAFTTGGGYV
jgi:predicted Zn-dependent protease